MSALARIEIAASPAEVRRVFLEFPKWSKIGDPVIRHVALVEPAKPVAPGAKIKGNFAGHENVLTVTENTPQTFSWHLNAFGLFTGDRKFQFLPSEITPGHTTFVNSEVFGRVFWALVAAGVMKEQKAFEAFNGKFKTWVEGELGVGGGQ